MGTSTAVTADGDDVVVTNEVVLCGSSMLVVISSGVGVDITMESSVLEMSNRSSDSLSTGPILESTLVDCIDPLVS